VVEVENCYRGYDKGWNWTTLRSVAKLSNRCYARLVREAVEHFEGFGLDFSQYDQPVVTLDDEITAQVEWTHKVSGKTLTLTSVWFNERTGEINQCGTSYGGLVS
jgi:hypothetical protein